MTSDLLIFSNECEHLIARREPRHDFQIPRDRVDRGCHPYDVCLTRYREAIPVVDDTHHRIAIRVSLEPHVMHAPVAVSHDHPARRALRGVRTCDRNLVDPFGPSPSRVKVEEDIVR